MKMQRVLFTLDDGNGRDPSFFGAAVVSEFDGTIKYIIGEHDSLRIYHTWQTAILDRGPLAYMDTVAKPQFQPNPNTEAKEKA